MKCLIKTVVGLIFTIILVSTNTFAQTNISGTINGDSTIVWNLAGSPYVIAGSTTISTLDTVKIESGVEVRFANSTQLTVSGALIANGVSFTANTGTARSTWNRIYTNNVNSLVHLSNSTIQFGTQAIDHDYGVVRLDTVTISDSQYGISVSEGTQTTINGSTLTGNVYPVYYSSEGVVSYEGTNDLTGNDIDVVYLANPTNIDVNLRLENPGIPYLFSSSKYVSSGDTLTIDKGNILKFNQNNELYTQNGATIIANGTPSDVIYFTSNRNDNIGGDTNNDGTATVPGNRDWYGIRIFGNSTSSSFNNVNISFAGYQNSSDYRGGITLYDNDSEIDSSTFNNNYYGIVLRDSSDATITNNTIGSSGIVPVALTFDSSPTFTNNAFSSANNAYDAIGLLGTTISGTNYLPKRDFTSIPNVTYLLLSELYVSAGSTLEIEPGVVIKSTGPGIRVLGTLISDGTDTDPIVLTSFRDDNIGNPNDTNKDGNNTAPANNNWRGIAFGENADASIIDYNQIRYAGYNTSFNYGSGSISPRGVLNLYNADITISNTEIGNTTNFGIDSRGISKPSITNNSFSNTGSVPVALDLSSDPTFSGNTLANVGLTGIGYHGGTFNNDGIIRARTFAGYDNITSVLLADITIASGTSLTIEPGTVIKSQTGPYGGLTLKVEGALNATGTADSVIYFTSILDDQVGNPLDTNGDGGGTSPGRGNWGSIRFMGTSDDGTSEISHTELRYGRHGVIFTDAAPTIDNVTILSCWYFGFGIESGSNVSINNSTIQNCGLEPVAISSNSNPSFSNITFNSNGSNGVNLLEANSFTTTNWINMGNKFFNTRSTITSDVTITPYSFAGYPNIPYVTRSTWYVGTNTTVTVDPSVILKGDDRLYIDGALRILGTESEPVIFTSYNDDSAGGDSNNDGNISVPSPGQSALLNFRASSIDSLSLIKNTEFRYPSTALQFDNSGGKVDSSLIQLSRGDAIFIYGNSDPIITNTKFENIGSYSAYRGHSIYMDMFSNPSFSNNSESNVYLRGLGIRGGTWGSDATIPFRSFAGTDSITYVLSGNITIPSGSKIIIPDGMTFKKWTQFGYIRNGSRGFIVNGALKINGTPTNPVVFTNDTDDDYGQPADLYSNGDENDTYKTGTWITYNSTSDDTANTINNAIFRYASTGIIANSANPTINNSTFNTLQYGISLTGVSEPFVENNSFEDLDRTPLLISLVSYPQVVSGNTMSGSTYKAIAVRSETLVQDVTLPKRTFAGKVGIPYYFTSTYTIGTGAVLTIEPGVINKFENGAGINVQKGLIAEGGSTPDSMIIFTSITDDFYGGDTNSNKDWVNVSAPNLTSGNWRGIRYEGTSLPANSVLDNIIVSHTYNGTSYGAILADNSSPTITNSILTQNGRGVQIYGSGNPVINNNDIYNNREYGVFNRDQTFTVDATNNWWGNNSGPTHSTNPTGTGDDVSDAVNFGAFKGSGASNPILGDVSLNGKVQSFDASGILRHVALLDTLNATQLLVGDVSGNGSVSAMDASYVLQYVVGLIEAFPAELNSKSREDMNSFDGLEDMILSLGESIENGTNEFTVPVHIENVKNLFSVEMDINFESGNLEFVEATHSNMIGEAMISENSTKPGTYSLAFATSTAINESGKLVNLTFRLINQNSSPKVSISRFEANEVNLTSTAVNNEEVGMNVPEEFKLHQNYPNPFNPSTNIAFDVPNSNTIVKLEIYNILGQKVKTLVNDVYSAGRYTVQWDATNEFGTQVSTGVYLYRLQAGDIVQSKKLTLIK